MFNNLFMEVILLTDFAHEHVAVYNSPALFVIANSTIKTVMGTIKETNAYLYLALLFKDASSTIQVETVDKQPQNPS